MLNSNFPGLKKHNSDEAVITLSIISEYDPIDLLDVFGMRESETDQYDECSYSYRVSLAFNETGSLCFCLSVHTVIGTHEEIECEIFNRVYLMADEIIDKIEALDNW